MEWRDQGIIIGARRYGENSIILEVFTRNNGVHRGLVKGGRSRSLRAVIQQGNIVDIVWRARLSEHLGTYRVEPITMVGARYINKPVEISAIANIACLASLLPEREVHYQLYEGLLLLLNNLNDIAIWPALLVRWELELLAAFGFGLDLAKCAVSGRYDDLAYISPKTGRAVCTAVGEPYKDKLFVIPKFLVNVVNDAVTADIGDGLKITSFFFNKYLFIPRALHYPECRTILCKNFLPLDACA